MKKADWKLILAAALCCVILFAARELWLGQIAGNTGKENPDAADQTETVSGETIPESSESDSAVQESYTEEETAAGYVVVVKKNGKLYGTYPLNEDQTVVIGDTNILIIEEGEAWMADASCPDQYCVMQGAISVPGPMIVCLPNRVTVQVEYVSAETEQESGEERSGEDTETDTEPDTEALPELDAVAG